MVLREVPADCTAVGVPARIARVNGRPVAYADDVDQIDVHDPILEELERLLRRVDQLESRVERRKKKSA